MADNVTLPGTGSSVAADDIGGALYQRVKLALGADGAAADLAPGQGLMAASVPVAIASNQSAVAVSGTFWQATQPVSIASAVPVTDNSGSLTVDGDVTVSSPDIVVTVTPTIEAASYAAGDLIFDATEIANAVRADGGHAILQSVTLLDKGDQGVAMTLVFANAATDFGTLNSAPDPDDTEAATVIGHVAVGVADYVDLGASKVACVKNIGLLLKAGAATSLYVAGINGAGAPTYASTADLVLQLGLLRS